MEQRLKFVLRGRSAQLARENKFEEDRPSDEDGEERVALPSNFLGSPAWTTLKTAEAVTLARQSTFPHHPNIQSKLA